MGRPYSTDLRERVLRACEVGDESQAAIEMDPESDTSGYARVLLSGKLRSYVATATKSGL